MRVSNFLSLDLLTFIGARTHLESNNIETLRLNVQKSMHRDSVLNSNATFFYRPPEQIINATLFSLHQKQQQQNIKITYTHDTNQ